jgi:hypothetical protein
MLSSMEWLRHAFATDPAGPAQPNEVQRLVVEKVCREVVRRRLTAPARLALEMSRPLNYVTAQLLHFFQPFLVILTDAVAYDQFTAFLEKRGSVDYIAERLEAIEAERATRSTPPPGQP